MIATKFFGTTEACFKHYSQTFQNPRKRMAEFIGVGSESVARWWGNGVNRRKPFSESLIRLQVFLTSIGYEVAGWQAYRESIRMIGFVIAFNIKTTKEIGSMLGYEERYATDQVYRLFDPNVDLSSERTEKLEELIEKLKIHQRDIDAGVQLLRDSHLVEGTGLVVEKEAKIVVAPKVRTTNTNINPLFFETLRRAIELARPLADHLASDSCSPEDRAKFRESFQDHELHSYRDALTKLCSEESRATVLKFEPKNK
jgi:hypothetical protein